jgi:hypothetical protein
MDYRSCADPDAELEKRLERLRTAKGATPYGQSAKASKPEVAPKESKKGVDYFWGTSSCMWLACMMIKYFFFKRLSITLGCESLQHCPWFDCSSPSLISMKW